jgi:hypothetical protein
MRRGQESPWLKFMENKGRSLLEWSENHLLDSFYFFQNSFCLIPANPF